MSKSTYSLKLPASVKKAAAELGRVSGYFVSAREYEELQRLRTFERRVHGITDLPPEIAEAVPGAKMSTVHDHLDRPCAIVLTVEVPAAESNHREQVAGAPRTPAKETTSSRTGAN